MTVIYLVSEGRPERERILAEVPLQRCIDDLGLDPSQRVHGLREDRASFAHRGGSAAAGDGQLLVASVGPEEAGAGFEPGHYWLDLTPAEVRRRLARA